MEAIQHAGQTIGYIRSGVINTKEMSDKHQKPIGATWYEYIRSAS